jgi:FkbM family methyltransferase
MNDLGYQFRTAIDGGAHIGTWTVPMAEIFGSVFAFEPAPDCFKCLKLNLAKFDNVNFRNVAIGAKQDRGTLVSDRKPSATISRYIVPGDDVDIVSLDDDLQKHDAVDLLKLDVEGFEHPALIGAARIIRKSRPLVIMECKQRKAELIGRNAEDAENYLMNEFGYVFLQRNKPDKIFAPCERI